MPKRMTICYTKDEQEFDEFFCREQTGFRTRNIDLISSIFNFLQLISESININLHEDGIHICVMDSNSCISLEMFYTKTYI